MDDIERRYLRERETVITGDYTDARAAAAATLRSIADAIEAAEANHAASTARAWSEYAVSVLADLGMKAEAVRTFNFFNERRSDD